MSNQIHHIGDDFWNIRGSFKIGVIIDIGTHTSLVRRSNGKFVFLDAYTLSSEARQQVDKLTRGGQDVEAILNLHPFHTVHVQSMHEQFPHARLYGTARHVSRFPTLPWEKTRTESPALQRKFAVDFEFSVPRGVDFISADENVHFSSVLALHRSSGTIHVDDTLMHIRLPGPARMLGLMNAVSFHPTLSRALEKRAGAGEDFRQWADDLIERWRDAENLCAAHTSALLATDNRGDSIHTRLLDALDKVSSTLKSHDEKY